MAHEVLDSLDSGDDLSGPGDAGGTPAPEAPEPAPAPAPAPAPPPAPAPSAAAPAPAPPAPGEERDAQGNVKTVPHAALHQAREEAKQLKQQIAQLEAQPRLTAEDAELLRDLRAQRQQQAAAPAAPAEPEPPDFLQDPKGYVDAQVARALKQLQRVEESGQQLTQAQQQQQQALQLQAVVSTHEGTYVKETPDYYDALAHARQTRADQLALIYPQATPAQLAQVVNQEERALAIQALQGGRNPAELVYKYAKTLGYVTKSAAPPPPPAPAPTDPKLEAAREAARTMGSSGAPNEARDEEAEADHTPELASALAERFGVKRK